MTLDLATLNLDEYERRDEPGLVVGRTGHVAVVLLDRPHRGNAFHTAMKDALGPLWQELDADPRVRCIVLGSTDERLFCTGRDVTEVAETGTVGRDLPMHRSFALTTRHAEVWKPVVCAVEGKVVGGGMHFVVDADIVVGSETATFLDSHVNVGFVGAIENIGLALKAGISNSLYLTLVGREVQLDAQRAYQLGLLQELVPAGTALARALELAAIVARNSPSAVARSLEAVWSLAYVPGYDQALQYGHQLLRRQWDHPDSTEGPRAWAERRSPEWTD
jgi:E-phenylitaconyl-CoA hydratase